MKKIITSIFLVLLCSCTMDKVDDPSGTGQRGRTGGGSLPPPPPPPPSECNKFSQAECPSKMGNGAPCVFNATINICEGSDGTILKDKTTAPGLVVTLPPGTSANGWTKNKVSDDAAIDNASDATNLGYRETPILISQVSKNINGALKKISVVYGNIVKEKVSAITNAANGGLAGGGGVDGAIQRAAGSKLSKEGVEYRKVKIGGVQFPVGSAMVTYSYNLWPDIEFIVHTVSPGGTNDQAKELQSYSAFYNSILKAHEYGATSVSIPSLGTGLFGYPIDIATKNFFKAAVNFYEKNSPTPIEDIRITNFDAATVKKYNSKLKTFFN